MVMISVFPSYLPLSSHADLVQTLTASYPQKPIPRLRNQGVQFRQTRKEVRPCRAAIAGGYCPLGARIEGVSNKSSGRVDRCDHHVLSRRDRSVGARTAVPPVQEDVILIIGHIDRVGESPSCSERQGRTSAPINGSAEPHLRPHSGEGLPKRVHRLNCHRYGRSVVSGERRGPVHH